MNNAVMKTVDWIKFDLPIFLVHATLIKLFISNYQFIGSHESLLASNEDAYYFSHHNTNTVYSL